MSFNNNTQGYPVVSFQPALSGGVDRSKANIVGYLTNPTPIILMASNSNRLGYVFRNQGNTNIAINLVGGTVTFTPTDGNMSFILGPGDYYVPEITATESVSILSDADGGMLYAIEY